MKNYICVEIKLDLSRLSQIETATKKPFETKVSLSYKI